MDGLMKVESKTEEFYNTLTHGLAAAFGLVGGSYLIYKALNFSEAYYLSSICVYVFSFVFLFSASTTYHWITNSNLKHKFRILDHISIYLLIAGTYTPICIILISDSLGYTLLYSVWGIAVFGAILKLFFTGKFELFSTLLYLAMGMLIVIDFKNVAIALGAKGVFFLYGGGLFYCTGIIFYLKENIKFNHVIWHIFVVLGAICHFLMILFSVF